MEDMYLGQDVVFHEPCRPNCHVPGVVALTQALSVPPVISCGGLRSMLCLLRPGPQSNIAFLSSRCSGLLPQPLVHFEAGRQRLRQRGGFAVERSGLRFAVVY